jgi:DNA-binding CsgD family transcriptional regulator
MNPSKHVPWPLPNAPPRRTSLPPRAAQTLDLLLGGRPDKAIAEMLGISRHTVNHYTKIIYRHFAVRSRAELMALLLDRSDLSRTRGIAGRTIQRSEAPANGGPPSAAAGDRGVA